MNYDRQVKTKYDPENIFPNNQNTNPCRALNRFATIFHLGLKRSNYPKVLGSTALAMIAFAANSIICRSALNGEFIDAAGFSTIRILSGAVVLSAIAGFMKRKDSAAFRGSWISAAMLTVYAVAFAFAYVGLSAGTGALILFGSVQVTMILAGLLQGERPRWLQWAGLITALAGLVYLVFPGWQSPALGAAGLMLAAGVGWGVYSLRGRGSRNPISVTGSNFVRAVPMVFVVNLLFLPQLDLTPRGVLLAVLSGAVTSGIGYVIWYTAIPYLSATRAATVQLSVPILAAIGGVVLLSEQITLRLVIASIMILGGIAAVFSSRGNRRTNEPEPKF